jgi:cellulose synthase (UDP-forming)
LGNGLPLLLRISLIETFLYWVTSFSFRLCCMLVPALFFLFDIRVVHASISDAIAHFAPMVIAQIAVTTWLGGGRMLPLISDVYQMLIAPEIVRVVAFTLIRPHGHKFNVTAKGIHHAGLNVQWRLLLRFLALAAITILGLMKIFAFDHSDLIEDGGALNVFWAWYNLIVLTICCVVCIEQPRRRLDERFATHEKAIVRIGDEVRLCEVTDLSASGMRLRGVISNPVGSPANVIMGDFESAAVIARKDDNEFALSLIGGEAREAMTRRVYSERYGKPIDEISASQVFAGILQRLAQ